MGFQLMDNLDFFRSSPILGSRKQRPQRPGCSASTRRSQGRRGELWSLFKVEFMTEPNLEDFLLVTTTVSLICLNIIVDIIT